MRRPLLAALAALVIPVPGALAGGVPGPQLQFTGPLNLTTPADVQAQANELTGKRSPAPMAAQPPRRRRRQLAHRAAVPAAT